MPWLPYPWTTREKGPAPLFRPIPLLVPVFDYEKILDADVRDPDRTLYDHHLGSQGNNRQGHTTLTAGAGSGAAGPF